MFSRTARGWRKEVDIKEIIRSVEDMDEVDDETAQEVARNIVNTFLVAKVRMPEDIKALFEDAISVEDVDAALQELYDWADEARVWLGL